MTLVGLLVALIIFGVVLYLVQLIPMDATVKKVIQVVAILFLILWLLQAFGLFSLGPSIRVK